MPPTEPGVPQKPRLLPLHNVSVEARWLPALLRARTQRFDSLHPARILKVHPRFLSPTELPLPVTTRGEKPPVRAVTLQGFLLLNRPPSTTPHYCDPRPLFLHLQVTFSSCLDIHTARDAERGARPRPHGAGAPAGSAPGDPRHPPGPEPPPAPPARPPCVPPLPAPAALPPGRGTAHGGSFPARPPAPPRRRGGAGSRSGCRSGSGPRRRGAL